MTGNVRATSLMGKDAEATYINSTISSEGWGALSSDQTSGAYLNVINCKVNITGPEGYGNYNDPDAHVAYYGTEFNMATFASVIGSGDVYYEEPASAPKPIEGFDNTSTRDAATANFSNIDLKGDFYNSVGWGKLTDKLNMVLNLNKSSITGVVSASESHHPSAKITTANHTEFHSLTDKACAAVNNGVIVNLANGSKWTVTGTSYLTRLVIEKGSSVAAPSGRTLTMTVDGGQPITNITEGEYKGNIIVMVK